MVVKKLGLNNPKNIYGVGCVFRLGLLEESVADCEKSQVHGSRPPFWKKRFMA